MMILDSSAKSRDCTTEVEVEVCAARYKPVFGGAQGVGYLEGISSEYFYASLTSDTFLSIHPATILKYRSLRALRLFAIIYYRDHLIYLAL